MTKPIVFMYSGQGSQYFHMTRELYEQHPRYRLWLEYCDDIAAPLVGRSVLETVFDPGRRKSDPFDSLADSNAALICVEYSLTQVVREMGVRPDVLLGYSLGEITAAVVGEVIPLELGIWCAVEFARVVERCTPPSAMLAVVGASEPPPERVGPLTGCWVTGRNFDGNFVVSGHAGAVAELQRALEREGLPCQRLPVNYGVHTELIDPAESQVRDILGTLSFAPSQVPIVSATSADRVGAVTADGVWNVLRRPVEFSRTVRAMIAERDAVFLDLGPSATLATFVKYLLPPGSGSEQVSTVNRFGNDLQSLREFQERMAVTTG